MSTKLAIEIRHARRDDIPTLAALTLSAFATNCVHSRVIPASPPSVAEKSLKFWEKNLGEDLAESLENPNVHFLVAVASLTTLSPSSPSSEPPSRSSHSSPLSTTTSQQSAPTQRSGGANGSVTSITPGNMEERQNRGNIVQEINGDDDDDKNESKSESEIAALAKWTFLPPPCPSSQRPPTTPLDPTTFPGPDKTLGAKFFEALTTIHGEIMGAQPHMYLELIAVSPKYQGRGIGAELVKWGCDHADEVGVEAYLDATPQGKRLYEKFGFEGVKSVAFDAQDGGSEDRYVQCFMVRGTR